MLFICTIILVLDLWYSVSVYPVVVVNGLAFLQRCYSLLTAQSACHTHTHSYTDDAMQEADLQQLPAIWGSIMLKNTTMGI